MQRDWVRELTQSKYNLPPHPLTPKNSTVGDWGWGKKWEQFKPALSSATGGKGA